MTVVLGIAGAVAGFYIFEGLFGWGDTDKFDLGGLPGAVIGAMILLFLYERFAGGGAEHAGGRNHADGRSAAEQAERRERRRERRERASQARARPGVHAGAPGRAPASPRGSFRGGTLRVPPSRPAGRPARNARPPEAARARIRQGSRSRPGGRSRRPRGRRSCLLSLEHGFARYGRPRTDTPILQELLQRPCSNPLAQAIFSAVRSCAAGARPRPAPRPRRPAPRPERSPAPPGLALDRRLERTHLGQREVGRGERLDRVGDHVDDPLTSLQPPSHPRERKRSEPRACSSHRRAAARPR